MDEGEMLQDLKRRVEKQLAELEDQIILYDPRDDDEEFKFLIKKTRSYRDTLDKINQRIAEL